MTEGDLSGRLPTTLSVIQTGIERTLHTGCQLYISRHGSVVADCGIGESHPGQPMTADTINLWLSAGKPLTAAAILRHWQQDELSLDDRVSRFIPEFASGGKGAVTIRHLLTHTGGFRTVETGWPEVPWNEIISRIAASPIESDWVVGRTAGYHTTTSWFILGEILARVSGQSYVQAMQESLLDPLGLVDTFVALTPRQQAHYSDRLGWLYAREQGELKLLDWNSPIRCQSPSPGANTRGPIRELGHFYEMLLNNGKSPSNEVLWPTTVATMTARQRIGEFDQTLAHIVDFGLGVIVDSNQYGAETVPYGYGKYCSQRTFGHGGAQSSQGWCDPECGLVVAYFFNGRPGEAQHNKRVLLLNEAIYEDLGLAKPR